MVSSQHVDTHQPFLSREKGREQGPGPHKIEGGRWGEPFVRSISSNAVEPRAMKGLRQMRDATLLAARPTRECNIQRSFWTRFSRCTWNAKSVYLPHGRQRQGRVSRVLALSAMSRRGCVDDKYCLHDTRRQTNSKMPPKPLGCRCTEI